MHTAQGSPDFHSSPDLLKKSIFWMLINEFFSPKMFLSIFLDNQVGIDTTHVGCRRHHFFTKKVGNLSKSKYLRYVFFRLPFLCKITRNWSGTTLQCFVYCIQHKKSSSSSSSCASYCKHNKYYVTFGLNTQLTYERFHFLHPYSRKSFRWCCCYSCLRTHVGHIFIHLITKTGSKFALHLRTDIVYATYFFIKVLFFFFNAHSAHPWHKNRAKMHTILQYMPKKFFDSMLNRIRNLCKF